MTGATLSPDRLRDLLDQVLAETVATITGDPNAKPRPGQHALAHDVLAAMVGRDDRPGHLLGCAPTGVGKALGCAAPAAIAAVAGLGRTLISTESIALQTQLLAKDLPDVADAVRQTTGHELTFTVFKGWSNYGCPVAAVGWLGKLTGIEVDLSGKPDDVLDVAMKATQEEEGDEFRLIEWVLLEAASGGRGDKATCDQDVTGWPSVSVSPTECLGNTRDSGCPLAAVCPAARARADAAEADIVVTNHSMLAIQAARDASVVLSNPNVGLFRHLVVDEAHALPEKVRNAGAHTVDARTVSRLAQLLASKFGSTGSIRVEKVDKAAEDGQDLADRLDTALLVWLNSQQGETPAITDDDDPLVGIGPELAAWTKLVKSLLPATEVSPVALDVARVSAAADDLADAVSAIINPEEAVARWVERGFVTDQGRKRGWSGAAARISPVDVADAISGNLFSTTNREPGAPRPRDQVEPRLPLSVTMVSATMPRAFGFESGVPSAVTDYASPFAAAYAASALYIPRVSDSGELGQVGSIRGNRWRFDVWRHPQWAAEQIVDLAAANGGSALILVAKADTGRLYAERLRAATRLRILSQWDGGDVGQIAAAWKADRDAVLVGTRSLMTGLDAAGDTCTLVVIDRVLRAPNNVVDDARVAAAMARSGLDKWSADRLIYGGDASTRMAQAAGRLIRRVTDSGMVAVLDPRLMKSAPLSYPESTRSALMTAFAAFPNRTSDKRWALAWLRARSRDRVPV